MSKHKKRIESCELKVENHGKPGKRLKDIWKKGW